MGGAGAGPGFPGVVTRFRLQTHPAPRVMWHDTWTFGLEDTVELLTWLHDVLPGLDRRVEPVVAATRLRDVPLFDGTARPDGTVLLLHTTVMADSDSCALTLLAPLRGWRSPTWPRRPRGSAMCSGWCASSGSGSRRWT